MALKQIFCCRKMQQTRDEKTTFDTYWPHHYTEFTMDGWKYQSQNCCRSNKVRNPEFYSSNIIIEFLGLEVVIV